MAKKLTEKQIAKRKAKQEKEEIVNKYINDIQEIIDQGYINMSLQLEEFNNDLMKSTLVYSELEQRLTIMIKTEEFTDKDIDEVMNEIQEIETRNDELYFTITSRDMKQNKLLKHLPGIASSVGNVIAIAEKDLLKANNKNKAYIVSLLINRSMDIFKEYNHLIVDVALESNTFIDTYIDARENFLDFMSICKKELEKKINSQKAEIVIEESIKYNQRLRVEYSVLTDFLKHKGYECDRQGSTTHAVWKHVKSGHSVPLPNKSGTVPQGTTSKVLKQIGSNRSELANYLYA